MHSSTKRAAKELQIAQRKLEAARAALTAAQEAYDAAFLLERKAKTDLREQLEIDGLPLTAAYILVP